MRPQELRLHLEIDKIAAAVFLTFVTKRYTVQEQPEQFRGRICTPFRFRYSGICNVKCNVFCSVCSTFLDLSSILGDRPKSPKFTHLIY